MKTTKLLVSALALALASPLAMAHKEGELILRAGAAMVDPQTDSDEVELLGAQLPGTKATVNENTQLGITLGYMVTDHIGVELLAATPFQHRIGLKGFAALGLPTVDGKFADVKHLPPTLTVQYFPLDASSKWQPYVGAGLNYTTFFEAELTDAQRANGFHDLELEDSWGLALQVGSDFMITDKLMLNASIWYVDINTTAKAKLTNGALGLNNAKVEADVEIDPWVFMLGVGYKF